MMLVVGKEADELFAVAPFERASPGASEQVKLYEARLP